MLLPAPVAPRMATHRPGSLEVFRDPGGESFDRENDVFDDERRATGPHRPDRRDQTFAYAPQGRLQVSAAPDFAEADTIFQGPSLSFTVRKPADGLYFYRVRGKHIHLDFQGQRITHFHQCFAGAYRAFTFMAELEDFTGDG